MVVKIEDWETRGGTRPHGATGITGAEGGSTTEGVELIGGGAAEASGIARIGLGTGWEGEMEWRVKERKRLTLQQGTGQALWQR